MYNQRPRCVIAVVVLPLLAGSLVTGGSAPAALTTADKTAVHQAAPPPAAGTPATFGPAAAGPAGGPSTSAVVAPAPASYAYDAAGRLVGVTRPAGETARYSYDAAGNVVGVARYPSATLSVLSVVPAVAKANAPITIAGTGFPTAAGSATVSFNGVPVTVTPASDTSITVNVPPTASTGPLTVRAGGTTVSGGTFTVVARPPVINSISPANGPPKTELTITGSGFDPVLGNDVVAIGGRPLDVQSVSATSIRAVVPVGVGSGVVSVSAPRGVANGPDFFVPPPGVDPGLVDSYRRLSASAAPTPIAITTPGGAAVVIFAAPSGGNLSIGFTDPTFGGSFDARVFGPDGLEVPGARAYASGPADIDMSGLRPNRTYQLLIRPAGGTDRGQVTVDLSEPVTGTLSPSGPPFAGTVRAAGQDLRLRFDSTQGRAVSLAFTGITLPRSTDVDVLAPGGAPVTEDWSFGGGSNTRVSLDLTNLPATGTYEVVLDPLQAVIGDVAVTFSERAYAGRLTRSGPPVVATAYRLGQDVALDFDGVAGTAGHLAFANSTFDETVHVSLFDPSGNTIVDREGASGGMVALPVLPATGRYQVLLAPYRAAAGRVNVAYVGTAAQQASARAAEPARQPLAWERYAAARSASRTEYAHVAAESPESWTPDESNLAGLGWHVQRPDAAPAEPLRAPSGVTALAGRALTLDAKPLAGVRVTAGDLVTTTDGTGRFLLAGVTPGSVTFTVDGGPASSPGRRFGTYTIKADVPAGSTTALPYTVWMQRLDTEHMVRIDAPTTRETVLTTPKIPGLEVRLPAGTVVRDANGNPVTELGITPVPLNRTPYPLPKNGMVPMYFMVQPGGTFAFPEGAQVIYPNYTRLAPGTRVDFIDYDPERKGWHTYGHGTVTPDGRQVVPDPDTRVWAFNLSVFNSGALPIWDLSRFADLLDWLSGDPVDLATGQVVDSRTDLAVEDTMSAVVSRSYWQADTAPREFGIGQTGTYSMILHTEDQQTYSEVDLYLPGGQKVHFVRTSPGDTATGAVFAARGTAGEYRGAVIERGADRAAGTVDGWVLQRRDGTRWIFPLHGPRLAAIRDRNGNLTRLTRSDQGDLLQITTPNGRWIKFTHDDRHRVKKARDTIGREVTYDYDAAGRLEYVTDAAGKRSQYTYQPDGKLRTVKDAREITYLTNEYDAAGRVKVQTLTDGQVFRFDYTAGADGRVTETRVTQPNGAVRRVTFNAVGAPVTDTQAHGTALARTTTIERGGDQTVSAVVDDVGRRTTVQYDAEGRLRSTTRLAGTANATVSGVYTYGGPFDQPLTYTDEAGKVTRYTYEADGDLKTVTDPMNRVTRFTYDESGSLTEVTDPAGATTRMTYQHGNLVAVTDPLHRTRLQFIDAAGRVAAMTDPAGATSLIRYNALNQVREVTDPLGNTTKFDHDENGNLLTLTDPRNKVTRWTYDASDRVEGATDPVGRATNFDYEPLRVRMTSRSGKVTVSDFDLLGRPAKVSYGVTGGGAESSVTFGYDDDRSGQLETLTDSAAGVTSFGYDRLDRLETVTRPQGSSRYTYLRTGLVDTVTETGQPMIDNDYDDSGAARTITQGPLSTGIAFDAAGRPDSLTLPGGWTQDPTYDDAGQVTFISYRHNDTSKGTLAYQYDAAGRIAGITGSFARVGVPEPRSALTYDNANRLTAIGGTALQYDLDGNLTNDGTTSYAWNARGQLAGLTRGGLTASFGYGPEGDRVSRTVAGTATEYLNRGPMPVSEKRGAAVTGLHAGGIDEWFHRAEPNGGRTYLTDVLGSTVALGDAAGAVRTQYGYEPFGATTVVGDATQNAFTYTGREDDGTGLMYYRARYYSPTLQRFISEDPIGHAGGTNLYAYAADSPTNYTDPSGNNPVLGGCLAGGLVEGVLSMAGQRLAGRKVDWGWGGVGGAAALGCAVGAIGGLAALGGKANSCLINSFAAGTLVLMADGTRKPIEQVRPGDRVLATPDGDADSGRRTARTVSTVISGTGEKRLIDLTIDGSVVTATDGHPFWLPDEDRWATAGELRVGQWLRTAAGTYAQVDAVAVRSAHLTVYNLTVEEDHTYYVVAGDDAVLVHNCSPSSALGASMDAAGVARPAETAAHHIVAASSPKAKAARRALKGAGIDINDARNGVYLPRNSASANPTGASVHSRIHTDEYYDYVNDLMATASGDRRRATAVLNRLRRELLAGQWP